MEIKLGYNKLNSAEYEHSPNSEKALFRDAILHNINSQKLDIVKGIEIGVLNGETTNYLLSIYDKINLIGIDPIIPDSMESSLIGNIEIIRNNTQMYSDRFDFIQDYSFNVFNRFEDESFDFIFIDGDHTFDAVSQDFNLYYPKVKKQGLIFMHDSRMYRGGANFHVGSSQFAEQLINNDSRLELIGEAFSLTCFLKK
jgi:hypothetical protein